MKTDGESGREVISALAGHKADRECAVGCHTRRVVLASLGVLQDQKAGRKRVRAVALAAAIVLILFVGPFLSWFAEFLGADDRLAGQIALLGGFLACALLAAVLVAGWMRNRP